MPLDEYTLPITWIVREFLIGRHGCDSRCLAKSGKTEGDGRKRAAGLCNALFEDNRHAAMGTRSHLGPGARKNCGWWVSGDRKHCGVRRKENRFRPIRMSELFLAGVVGALVAAETASLVFPLVN